MIMGLLKVKQKMDGICSFLEWHSLTSGAQGSVLGQLFTIDIYNFIKETKYTLKFTDNGWVRKLQGNDKESARGT